MVFYELLVLSFLEQQCTPDLQPLFLSGMGWDCYSETGYENWNPGNINIICVCVCIHKYVCKSKDSFQELILSLHCATGD